jgi:hypothetical protein
MTISTSATWDSQQAMTHVDIHMAILGIGIAYGRASGKQCRDGVLPLLRGGRRRLVILQLRQLRQLLWIVLLRVQRWLLLVALLRPGVRVILLLILPTSRLGVVALHVDVLIQLGRHVLHITTQKPFISASIYLSTTDSINPGRSVQSGNNAATPLPGDAGLQAAALRR